MLKHYGRDLRWTDDPWALRWTAGFLRADQQGPLPWWLSAHRAIVDERGYHLANTEPQTQAFRVDWSHADAS